MSSYESSSAKIIDKIKKVGPVTFKTFMEMALYEPELGYYTSQKTRIGRSGDFLHKLPSPPGIRNDDWKTDRRDVEIMGRPSAFQIVEMGSGAGYLCKDILDYYKERVRG